jgi:DNA-binding MarR family transcriptional regulator
MAVAEEAFEHFRRIAFEGEITERIAALSVRLSLSPGLTKTLVRLAGDDGVSMGEVARRVGCDPSYATALVDELGARGLARREPAPDDRRVKIVVLTDAGRELAAEVEHTMAVPPAAFSALDETELRQLRDLLAKVAAAAAAAAAADDTATAGAGRPEAHAASGTRAGRPSRVEVGTAAR